MRKCEFVVEFRTELKKLNNRLDPSAIGHGTILKYFKKSHDRRHSISGAVSAQIYNKG
ncbi:MAG: hypothetical protein NY202_01275 [Mollicutes bacterium UO1]